MYMTSRSRPLTLALGLAMAVVIASHPAAQQPDEPATANHPWIGQTAPDIELVTTSGETVSLGGFRGNKFVVLHFAASW
jgi:hypothetical protein